MPLPVITNTVRVAVRGTMPSGQRWINVWHIRKPAGPILAADITAIDGLFPRFYLGAAIGAGQFVFTQCNPAVTMEDLTYTPLDGSSASTVIAHLATGAAAGVDTLPSEVTAVMTLRTLLRGRSHRGRIYLPTFVETINTALGTILVGTAAALITQLIGVQANLVAAGYEIVVASYLLASATSVSTFTMDSRWDVQRGRK